MIGTNGTTQTKASRTNWNVHVTLRGYPNTTFQRSPVLGTHNIRVRPTDPKAFLSDYLAAHPEVLAELGVELLPGENVFDLGIAEDLFCIVCSRLEGVAGYHNREAPSLETGLSFRVPVSDQVSINRLSGVATASSPAHVPCSKEDLAAKIAAQRARLMAARNATNQSTQADTTEPAA